MSNITIHKAKLVDIKGGYALKVDYQEAQEGYKPKKISLDNPRFVHPDLTKAMQHLAGHFALRTGYLSLTDYDPAKYDAKRLEDYHVHGITLSLDDEDPWVIISGHKDLPGSSPVNTHTPITRLAGAAEEAYPYVADLLKRLDKLRGEIEAYVAETKVGRDPQGDLFDEAPVTKAQIAEPSTRVGDGSVVKIPKADPDAMARVREGDNDKPNRRRRVQTPENPDGNAKQE